MRLAMNRNDDDDDESINFILPDGKIEDFESNEGPMLSESSEVYRVMLSKADLPEIVHIPQMEERNK
ncbi:unnamed protein product, partial [Brachionus calyciflorus]